MQRRSLHIIRIQSHSWCLTWFQRRLANCGTRDFVLCQSPEFIRMSSRNRNSYFKVLLVQNISGKNSVKISKRLLHNCGLKGRIVEDSTRPKICCIHTYSTVLIIPFFLIEENGGGRLSFWRQLAQVLVILPPTYDSVVTLSKDLKFQLNIISAWNAFKAHLMLGVHWIFMASHTVHYCAFLSFCRIFIVQMLARYFILPVK